MSTWSQTPMESRRVPSSEVVIYESIVVGASVIGFFVCPFLYYRRPQTIDATSDITGVTAYGVASSPTLLMTLMTSRGLLFGLIIAGEHAPEPSSVRTGCGGS